MQFALWSDWTRAEGAALRAADWEGVAECQEQKAALRAAIDDLSAAAERERASSRGGTSGIRTELREQIEKLIAMEQANQAVLTQQLEMDLRRQADLTVVHRNLSRVHRSYTRLSMPNWQSYS